MISAIGINDVLLSAMSESEDVIIRTVSFNEPSEKIANRMAKGLKYFIVFILLFYCQPTNAV